MVSRFPCPGGSLGMQANNIIGTIGSVHHVWSVAEILERGVSLTGIISGDSLTQGAHDQSRGFALGAELQAGTLPLNQFLIL
jgi:hypothetical protein